MKCALLARLAQSAERKTLNLVVVGSSPTLGASLRLHEPLLGMLTALHIFFVYFIFFCAGQAAPSGYRWVPRPDDPWRVCDLFRVERETSVTPKPVLSAAFAEAVVADGLERVYNALCGGASRGE